RDYKVTGIQTCALPIWTGHESLAGGPRLRWPQPPGPGSLAANCSPRALAAIRHQAYADLSRGLDAALAETLDLLPWYNSAANPRSEERRVGKECRSRVA